MDATEVVANIGLWPVAIPGEKGGPNVTPANVHHPVELGGGNGKTAIVVRFHHAFAAGARGRRAPVRILRFSAAAAGFLFY